MSTKTNAEMLKSIKQYNKTAREEKAKKEGFASASVMIAYLENQVNSGKGSKPYVSLAVTMPSKKLPAKVKVSKKVLIYVADILDSSGSMSGGKYDAATKGINLGIKGLKEDKAPVDYNYTLCDFSDTLIYRYDRAPLEEVTVFKGHTRGSTSLYDAIGKTVAKLEPIKSPTDKVLVNIYTDGQENSSRHYKAQDISNMIERLTPLGWTFTFIGTAQDVKFAQERLKFHDSNTLVHDNTERGFVETMSANTVARTSYSAKVAKGEDVSTGFYKDVE